MSQDRDFEQFIVRIKQKTAIDLSQYKEAQMKRRLTTLRMKHGYTTFEDYWKAIEQNRSLLNEFLDRMTINVSEFWRNPSRWDVLQNRFLPELLKSANRIKVWSAACSTGEEPYTLAMILAELGALQRSSLLATDLDAAVLQKAMDGSYLERSLRDVPASCRQTYFKQADGAYLISEQLKKHILFKQQNLLHDAFDSSFDLIVCRNVMIYFTEEAKHQLYHKFAKALKPGGMLFVGSTEQIFSPSQYGFETADTFFYRRVQL
ncbi:protein-glutamate O-methyltransferase CheR [Paenibacillus alkaliterrae]|uniref:CheR family methyltransferase n=1 Tax=Paenibacillus alkaliterrae TaxID=320909 RepID=UPI001F3942A5|nr:protein-glutamate O-methyltransferase CheR [Paenibacillus alkaliterrae]MCF2937610.1 protein-glutamate O-methyltransferase CheR [Paenibacillus alkaliterrae]